MRALAVLLSLTLGPIAAASGCAAPCSDVPAATALDYADEGAWACKPGRDDACSAADLSATEIRADGTTVVVPHVPDPDPAVDCFWVYPTLDLRGPANVHTELSDTARIEQSIVNQAGRFSEVCALHAPLYRQVTVGTYTTISKENRDRCFEVAFADVRRAFESFLDNAGTRPFVVGGHSQGGQIVSRLVREVIEPDPDLLARLLVAMPIGWPLATAAGERTGGSFERVPVCESAAERGCAVGYRSFTEGHELPGVKAEFAEGDEIVCSEIADPDGTGDDRLARVFLPWDNAIVTLPDGVEPTTTDVLYKGAFAARCVRDAGLAGLEWRWDPAAGDSRANPADLDHFLATGANGAHLFDLTYGAPALVDLVRAKAAP